MINMGHLSILLRFDLYNFPSLCILRRWLLLSWSVIWSSIAKLGPAEGEGRAPRRLASDVHENSPGGAQTLDTLEVPSMSRLPHSVYADLWKRNETAY
ncbi:hypothetical protein NQ318_002099 [Aromia moschata]|uniref:Uncharacterized protein n=1 Tax=Aromia moschata TaxID=1265417 RepID=A0AAV8Y945_9CUCU|nr:hypothetical protein NQ318_002099 [Aromia moschata]